MTEPVDVSHRPRGIAARLGICLLNLLRPGLGLFRLAHYRWGFAFIALDLAVLAGFAVASGIETQLTYGHLIAALAIVAVYFLVACGVSVALSWRWSAEISPRRGWLWRWYGILSICALLIAFSWPINKAITLNYRNFYTPTATMAPTLEPGDQIVAKMRDIYPISRGDVVIARQNHEEWVKRIVGIPGDTVAMRDGNVIINGVQVRQQILAQIQRKDSATVRRATLLSEQLPGERTSHRILDFGQTPQDDLPPVKLGPSQYFLLGDNRDNSMDSRFSPSEGGLGLVDRSSIAGRVLFRYWRRGVGLGDGRV